MKTNFAPTFKTSLTSLAICLLVNTASAKSFSSDIYTTVGTTTSTSPVKYSSIDAMINSKNAVVLSWVTELELNNNHFEVERSFDNENFKSVGLVLDALTVEGSNRSYNFKDNSADLREKAVAYYRLKQVSKEGTITQGVSIVVNLQSQQNNASAVAPNPFTQKVILSFEAKYNTNAEVRISSTKGQTLLSKQSNVIKGNNNLLIEGLDNLSNGMYVAQVLVNGTVIASQKVVKK